MGRPKSTEGGKPISIRLSDRLMGEIKEASKQIDRDVSETMREALEIGLRDLKLIGYDRVGAIVRAAKQVEAESKIHQLPPSHWQSESLRAAEDPPHGSLGGRSGVD